MNALNFVDSQIAAFVGEIHRKGLDGNTSIILSAKHGQSPTDPAALTRIPDGPLLGGLNAAWKAAHPGAGDLVVHATDDDGMPTAFTASGLAQVFAGRAAAMYFDGPGGDPRVPGVFGIAQHGVVYTGGKGKIAEHGGADPKTAVCIQTAVRLFDENTSPVNVGEFCREVLVIRSE